MSLDASVSKIYFLKIFINIPFLRQCAKGGGNLIKKTGYTYSTYADMSLTCIAPKIM